MKNQSGMSQVHYFIVTFFQWTPEKWFLKQIVVPWLILTTSFIWSETGLLFIAQVLLLFINIYFFVVFAFISGYRGNLKGVELNMGIINMIKNGEFLSGSATGCLHFFVEIETGIIGGVVG